MIALAVAVSGCQSSGNNAFAPYPAPYPTYDYSQTAPTPAGAVPAAAMPPAPVAQPAYNPVPYQALEANNIELKERLERVEKAMLRLDRRMQLVERNELSRMGATTTQNDTSSPLSQNTAPAGNDEQVAMRALGLGPSNNPDAAIDGFRPVSSRDEPITSALQAAPSLASAHSAPSSGGAPTNGMQLASRGGLPSLADPAPESSRSLQPGNAQVAIWTVKYDDGKVWPNRSQLPASRDVVDALRQSGSTANLTLYARGKNASAVEFRERVKALSRYLSKVSSLDSVPIAAMASPNLDDQTIEILVAH